MSDEGSRQTVKVRIAGEEHLLRSAADPAYTRECAALLDEKIREIREASGLIENHRSVILAALSLADEYLQASTELEQLRREVTSRSHNLVRRIEGELDGSE